MNYFNKIKVNNHSQTWFPTANVSCLTFIYSSSVATQTDSENINGSCLEKVIYVLQNVKDFAHLKWQVRIKILTSC